MTGEIVPRPKWSAETALAERQAIQRFGTPSFQAWADAYLQYQGQIYAPAYTTTYAGQKVEPPLDTFVGYVQGAYKSNGVIFSVSMARARPFSEIAFKWRRQNQTGYGTDLFGNQDLAILERPWPGGTTQQLLMRAEQDVTAAGTFFVAREGDRLRRLRPDWCEFILTSPPDQAVQADIVAVKYTPGGPWSGGPSRIYLVAGPEPEVAFWSPIPDPDALFRGMSWLSPVIDEFRADVASTKHKLAFFENAATPNLAVSLKETVKPEDFKAFVRMMQEEAGGTVNAYKTLFTGGGADVRVIGADMKQLDFAITQGHGETRVCAAGGVPPIIVGLSEGLQYATYSNYTQAKRAYADLFLRSQWRSLCGALEPILDVPSNAQLWYDAKDVAFLRDDTQDVATVQSTQAGTINTLITAGYTPDSAVKAVLAEDFSLLVHSGMMSVQLQPPGGAPADGGSIDGDTGEPLADDGSGADDEALASAVDQIAEGQ